MSPQLDGVIEEVGRRAIDCASAAQINSITRYRFYLQYVDDPIPADETSLSSVFPATISE